MILYVFPRVYKTCMRRNGGNTSPTDKEKASVVVSGVGRIFEGGKDN